MLDTYVEKHREAAEELTRTGKTSIPILLFSVDRRDASGKRIWVGGLADRLKGVVSCFLLSILTNRPLFIDWNEPLPLTHDFQPKNIDWRVSDSILKGPLGAEIPILDLVHYHLEEAKSTAVEHGNIEGNVFPANSSVKVHINLYIYSHVATEANRRMLESAGISLDDPAACFGSCFDLLFRYSPEPSLRTELENFRLWHRTHGRVIGLQLRTGGDGAWEDPVMFPKEQWLTAAEAVEQYANEQQTSDVGVFVSTDSSEAKKQIVERLGTRFPVYYLDAKAVHIDRSTDEEVRAGASMVILENSILAECDDLLVGRGGFGVLAAWRTGRPPTRIFC